MDLFLAFLFGVVASGVAALLYEYASRPSLEAEIDPNGRVRGSHSSLPPYEFHHLLVRNKSAFWPVPSRKPAWSTHARLEVLSSDGTLLIREPIYARWTSQPEPLVPAVGVGGHVNLIDPAKLITGRKVDVHSHEDQQISLLIKVQGEDACYVFSNESYLHPRWQNPAWRLPLGTFRVRLTVHYERGQLKREFQLVNKGPALEDVQLTTGT